MADWPDLDAALDELLSTPEGERSTAFERICTHRPELRQALAALLQHAATPDDLLDRPAIDSMPFEFDAHGSIAGGTRIGAFEIDRLIARGGMGEVYRAHRADGQFEQTVALKLVRIEADASIERFQAERQILAQLDHPCIARLLDGGIAPDGRPYMAMEYVEGEDIICWCKTRRAPLAKRLSLFLQVCDAVAYAHAHLIVHRDLKPANIIVTDDGHVKLLDFGIAKLLQAEMLGDATRTLHLSPAHAAPEQLTGGAVTTATDVYALGVTLYELVSGRMPWEVRNLPLAAAVQRLLGEVPRPPSAAVSPGPVSRRELRGDLDAVVARTLRAEPRARYTGARELAEDIRRHLRHEPVQAREGARIYVLRRFLRRNWRPLGALGAVFLALLAGIGGVTWEAALTRREAARANATRNFVVSIFRASDPRIATDKPRSGITARELLDAGASRLEQQGATDPELEIELLGTVASIYRELGDMERCAALEERELQLARRTFGELHPAVTNIMLDRASDAIDRTDYATALKLLTNADDLIRRRGQDQAAVRARWWLIRGEALVDDSAADRERERALQNSVDLFGRVAPHDGSYVTALTDLGNVYISRLDQDAGARYFRRALAVAETVDDRNDGEMQTIYSNLGMVLANKGDFAGSDHAFETSARIAGQTYGKNSHYYWVPAAWHARMVHLSGDRIRAIRMFEDLMRYLPAASGRDVAAAGITFHDAAEAREWYGGALVAEGRPQLGIPLLEASEAQYHKTSEYEYEVPRIRLTLGDAYDRVGRTQDARRTLQAALDERVRTTRPDSQVVLAARERWGRFLLSQGDIPGAEAQFREALAQAHGRRLAHIALALGDIARVNMTRGKASIAVRDAQAAVDLFEHVTGFRDVRMGPYLWQILARAQLLGGHRDAAQLWAQKALTASLGFDAPGSPEIAELRALLGAISAT